MSECGSVGCVFFYDPSEEPQGWFCKKSWTPVLGCELKPVQVECKGWNRQSAERHADDLLMEALRAQRSGRQGENARKTD